MRTWSSKKKKSYPFDQDAETVAGESTIYATLILFDTHKALGQHLAQAEVVFEYRSSSISVPDCSTFERNEKRGF